MALAVEKSFELRIRQAELAQQGFKLSLARNEKYPAFTIGPFYSHEQSAKVGEEQDIAGLSMSVPIPLWNRNVGNIATAEARRQQAEASFEVTRREVERKVSENAIIYAAKVNELSQSESQTTGNLRDSAASADEYYRAGAIPLTTYVEVQKQYLESLDGVLAAKTAALTAAQELEVLTGLSFFKTEPDRRQGRTTP
jgi:cobalt-zinc-cadmium efflux system outer membrane protein